MGGDSAAVICFTATIRNMDYPGITAALSRSPIFSPFRLVLRIVYGCRAMLLYRPGTNLVWKVIARAQQAD
jgi:hypothetical protein